MNSFIKMLQLQLLLLTLIVIGYMSRKLKLIDEHQQKGLSSLLLNIFLPANIIHSFVSIDVSFSETAYSIILCILISTIIQLAAIFSGPVFFSKFPESRSHVMDYGLIVSNSSFIGIPVIEYLYGPISTMYSSVFQIPIRLTMWTAGLSLFTEKASFKEQFIRTMKHPCVIAVFTGLLIMALHIELPSFIDEGVSYLSRCTTPISMLVIGSILFDVPLNSLFDKAAFYFSLIRLIIFPGIVILVLSFFKIDPMIRNMTILMSAMPSGATGAILAQQYRYDSQFAVRIMFVSTVISMITLPFLFAFL